MRRTLKTVLLYTVLYLLLALGVWGYFLAAGKSLICDADAYTQHINALMAYGKWMRGILWRLVHEHRLVLENYSFGIGYGADFFTSMQYYAVGDPLHLPVLFLPTAAVYYYYQFLILLRPYLAGLSFLALAEYHKRKASIQALVAGAVSYAFSGTVLFIGMWNPFFVNPMILFPLLLLGADRIKKGRTARLFTVAVFLAVISNFYFCYMMAVLTLIYAVVRRTLKKTVLPAILGIAMGAVVFLPVALAFFNNPRAGVGGHALTLFYEADYYRELFRNLVTYIYHPKYDTELGLTWIIVPVLVLFCVRLGQLWKRRDHFSEDEMVFYRCERTCAILLLLMILMLIFPAAGVVLNGFSYMINRWCWALVLFLCFLITSCWDDLVAWLNGLLKRGDGTKQVISAILLVLTMAGIVYNGFLASAPEKGNLPNGFKEAVTDAEFLTAYESTEVKAFRETTTEPDDAFYRYSGRNLVWNAGLLTGTSSTQFYFSLANGAVADFMQELAVNEMADYSFFGMDDRLAPLSLTGVKYYSLRFDTKEERRYVPASFVRAHDYYNFAIYENAFPLSLGYLYHRSIPEESYREMTPMARQTALLEGVVAQSAEGLLPEIAATADTAEQPDADAGSYRILPAEITEYDGSHVQFSKYPSDPFVADRDGATCTLSFTGEAQCETSLYWPALWTEGTSDMVNLQFTAYRNGEALTTKTLSCKQPTSQFYSGWTDYLVNFGYTEEPIDQIRITFPEAGTYHCGVQKGWLQVVQQPVQPMLEQIVQRSAEGMSDVNLHKNPVSFMTNRVTGSITASEPSYLLLNIPYAKGWTVYVDGEETALERANTMFMGCMIDTGTHTVELRYATPGLVAGALFSIMGGGIFLWMVLRSRNMRRREGEKQQPFRKDAAAAKEAAAEHEMRQIEVLSVAVAAGVIALVTIFPLLSKGLYGYAPDYLYHMNRIEGVVNALRTGSYPAAIYDHFFHGQGYASPLFYPDLFLIPAALLRIAGLSVVGAYKTSIVLYSITATVTTYASFRYMVRKGSPELNKGQVLCAALSGTFVLMLSQFYLADIVMRSGYSGYISYVFLPVWLAGLYDYCFAKGEKTWLLGIGFGGLLLSHTINTFIAVLLTVLCAVVLLFTKNGRRVLADAGRWRRLLLTAGITLLITGYYLFPMLEQMLSGTDFVYMHPWARISEHTEPFDVFHRVTGYFFNEAYVGLGGAVVAALLASVLMGLWDTGYKASSGKSKGRHVRRDCMGFVLAGVLLLVSMTDLLPWKLLEKTPLNNLQFTFRIYPFALLFLAAGFALVMGDAMQKKLRWRKIAQAVMTTCVILSVLFGVWQNLHVDFAPYQEVTGETVSAASDVVGKGEWLPTSYDMETGPVEMIAKTDEEGNLVYPKIYYKGYRALFEDAAGRTVSLACRESEKGFVSVTLPGEGYTLKGVVYRRTVVQRVSLLGSVGTGIALMILCVRGALRGKRKSGTEAADMVS